MEAGSNHDIHEMASRKSYVKPAVTSIKLVAEEAVLALCKFGNNGPGVRTACFPDRTCSSTRRS